MKKFHYLETSSVAERMSIQNAGSQKTTTQDIHRFAAMSGIQHIVTSLV